MSVLSILKMESLVRGYTNIADALANFFLRVEESTKDKQTLVGTILLVLGVNLYYWHKHSFWSRRNIKTPTPLPLFGNFYSFLLNPRQQLELEWPKKYGKLYGYYMGTKPYLVCADANIMKRICIKDFDKFPNHYFMGVKNKYQKHFLIFQRDNHWRGLRAILSPTFSSGKIKVMFKLLDNCSENLLQKLRQEVDETGNLAVLDSRKLFGAFSMSSALSSFYGISLNDRNEKKKALTSDDYAGNAREAFTMTPTRFILSQLMPINLLELFNITQMREGPMHFFYDTANKIISHRQDSSRKYNDYLQLLLEAKAEVKIEISESDKHEEHHAMLRDSENQKLEPENLRPSKMKLTDMEVSCQAMMLMMVATETTATLISHTAYLLAHYPEIQERLFKELSRFINDSSQSSFDYEQLTSCSYLDCVISESLRLLSPALFMDREASEDYYIKEYDLTIPKGTVIVMAFYAIHRDPEYWPNPDNFDPERFSPENKKNIIPGTYCPFGIGPRSCIGFRFALTEAKVAIAKLVTEFKLETAPDTVFPPEPKRITFLLNDNKNLFVSFKKRS